MNTSLGVAGIVMSTPVTHVRRKGAFRTSHVTGTFRFILVFGGTGFGVIGTVDAFETAVNTSFGVTRIIMSTPMAKGRRRAAFKTILVTGTGIVRLIFLVEWPFHIVHNG